MNSDTEKLLTTGDARRIAGVSRQTVIRWLDSGLLKGFRVPCSTHRRIDRRVLDAFLAEHGIPRQTAEQTPA